MEMTSFLPMEMMWNHESHHFEANFKPQSRQTMETMWFPHGNNIISNLGNNIVLILWYLTMERISFPPMEIMWKPQKSSFPG